MIYGFLASLDTGQTDVRYLRQPCLRVTESFVLKVKSLIDTEKLK